MRYSPTFLSLLFFFFAVEWSYSGEPNLVDTEVPKFELDIQPILTARGCNAGACHGKSRGQNGFALSLFGFDDDMDYRAIVQEGRGRRVFPAAPEESLLLRKATGDLPHGGGIRLTPNGDDYRQLIAWIRGGSPRTTADDPRLERLEITPAPHAMLANSTEQLTVTAIYSDQSTRDVTHTCAFHSNEPGIVSVSATGMLKAGTFPGEATVMARYRGRIATWTTAIPRDEVVPPEAYQQLPTYNFIDRLVWEKLKELRILPSGEIDDAKFLRRAYLDLIGRLPSLAETRQFLTSSEQAEASPASPDGISPKRERLLDALLERPEYADFWGNKWADLLRPNPYRVGIKAVLSFDGWLRDIFRRNVPYDQFVRELLTARGSTWDRGATVMYRDRRSPEEVTSMVSQLFLGVRLDCAKCHQHPFEVYGQKDFYSLAAFFGRVGYKGTGLSPPISGGEESIYPAATGNVRHPLTGEVLAPRPLLQEPIPIAEDEDLRERFASWATAPENPYFARVAVNRLWGELFGIGLVDPVDDLRATNPPSNPALLDALAETFIQQGFDQRRMLKTIMSSAVYARSSLPNATNVSDGRNFSRHYRQRLRAEVLADAISDVTQMPDSFEGMPPGSRAMELWTHRGESELLDAFGRPDPNQDPPCERMTDVTVVQTLHLLNAQGIHQKITHDEGYAARLSASELTPEEIIENLYLVAYNRFPTSEESVELAARFAQPEARRRQLVEDLMWSLLNSPEFIYKD